MSFFAPITAFFAPITVQEFCNTPGLAQNMCHPNSRLGCALIPLLNLERKAQLLRPNQNDHRRFLTGRFPLDRIQYLTKADFKTTTTDKQSYEIHGSWILAKKEEAYSTGYIVVLPFLKENKKAV